jgi:arylsulfatase A-like enzyme
MLNRDVLGWLAKRPAGRPFFAFLNYYDAHPPYNPPADANEHFGMAALPREHRLEVEARFNSWAAGMPVPADSDPASIYRDGVELFRDTYDSCIAYLDREVGLLFDELERRGELENTLVIVTSDHGEHLGERDLVGHAMSLYRREVHVPLLVVPPSASRPPALPVVRAPVTLREVPATVAEWVGLQPRSPFPGRSLTRFLAGDEGEPPDPAPVFSEVEHIQVHPRLEHIPASLGPVGSLVSPGWVYIRAAGGREELYDLVNDPDEANDLAGVPQSGAVLARFREELGRHCRCANAPAHCVVHPASPPGPEAAAAPGGRPGR